MQTIQLQIRDDVYEHIKNKGMDINNLLQDFIASLADEGVAPISTEEAKKRVSDAVNRYKNGTADYTNYDQNFLEEMESYIQSL
jgi:polyhydroxyalkanoate synthesis regulator phasin